MELLVEWVMWNLISFHLGTVLESMQYRCTICAECTIGLEIVLDAPDGTPR
jgi:cytidine deaminase